MLSERETHFIDFFLGENHSQASISLTADPCFSVKRKGSRYSSEATVIRSLFRPLVLLARDHRFAFLDRARTLLPLPNLSPQFLPFKSNSVTPFQKVESFFIEYWQLFTHIVARVSWPGQSVEIAINNLQTTDTSLARMLY